MPHSPIPSHCGRAVGNVGQGSDPLAPGDVMGRAPVAGSGQPGPVTDTCGARTPMRHDANSTAPPAPAQPQP